MKKYIVFTVLLFTALISLNGCTFTLVNDDYSETEDVFAVTDDAEETGEAEKVGEKTLPSYLPHEYIVESDEGQVLAPDGEVLATYSYSYPVFMSNEGDDAEYVDSINQMFKDNALSIANFTESDYESLTLEYEDSKEYEYQFRPHDYTCNYEIHLDAKGIISITETRYAYLGGAHGTAGKSSYTFDVVNGKELSLSDLLYGTEDEIVEAFAKEFVKVSDMFYYGDDPSEVVTEEFPYAEYYVDYEGVTAYFQEYHVGPYSSGFVSATISDKEMLKYDFSDTENER